MTARHLDGHDVIVELSLSSARIKDQWYAIWIVRDISERKRSKERARRQQQQLLHADKMISFGLLVSGVAHEINNPNSIALLNPPLLARAWESVKPALDEYYGENGDFTVAGQRSIAQGSGESDYSGTGARHNPPNPWPASKTGNGTGAEGLKMKDIRLTVEGMQMDFEMVRKMTEMLALRDNELATLVSWNDRDRDFHSPQCLKCEIKGEPGWEVYGRNHEGRLRISVNGDQFVLIYS